MQLWNRDENKILSIAYKCNTLSIINRDNRSLFNVLMNVLLWIRFSHYKCRFNAKRQIWQICRSIVADAILGPKIRGTCMTLFMIHFSYTIDNLVPISNIGNGKVDNVKFDNHFFEFWYSNQCQQAIKILDFIWISIFSLWFLPTITCLNIKNIWTSFKIFPWKNKV